MKFLDEAKLQRQKSYQWLPRAGMHVGMNCKEVQKGTFGSNGNALELGGGISCTTVKMIRNHQTAKGLLLRSYLR